MKKSLFLLLIAGVVGTTQAQTSNSGKPRIITVSPKQLALAKLKANNAPEVKGTQPSSSNKTKHNHRIANEPTNLPFVGSSANCNGVRDASTTAVTANQACGLIVMTHRENYLDVGTCGTGAYVAGYSTNGGTVWDSTVYISCNQPSRYPNGALFNGAGNTNPMNVTDAMSGPWTNSSTTTISWVETVYGSVTIGNTNPHESYWTNGVTAGSTPQNTGDLSWMSSSDDSTVHVIGMGYSENAAQTAFQAWYGAVVTTGKFNATADSFQWSQTVIRPHLVPEILGFATMTLPYDSDVFPSQPAMAWSQDGKTGYVVVLGNLDSTGYNYVSNQPIVYKTTNSGVTWAMMPMFNFRNLNYGSYLPYATADSGIVTPMWFNFALTTYAQGAQNDWDVTVDMNGNLHIFGTLVCAAYSNPDSAYNEHFYATHGSIFDVYTTTGTGGWQCRYIDSMQTFPSHVVTGVESNDWDNTTASSVAFGNRLQVSRTTNGDHIFVTWEDDTTGWVGGSGTTDSLISPDVFGQGFDINNSVSTPTYKFTNTSNNYYLCVSDIVMTSGTSPVKYTIPCTITYPQSIPNDGSTAMNYFYLDTVQYNDNEFTGIPTVAKLGFSITPNYPNPFNNITNFDVNLTKESVVSVEVYNLLGEQVYTIGAQKMSNGTHKMTLNGSGWNAGIYFYKVLVNGQSLTQKMVVQR